MAIAVPDVRSPAALDPVPGPQPALGPSRFRVGHLAIAGPGEAVRARHEWDGVLGGSLSPPGEADSVRGRPGSVTVLLPALNEEAGVGAVIDRIPVRSLRRSGYDVRVWVVDGQSTDGTLEVARRRGADVFVQTGEGKGNGVRQAISAVLNPPRGVGGDRVVVMLDADGSYPPEQIERLLRALESGADVVMGSRFLGQIEDGAITGLNRLGNRLLSGLASLLFGAPVSDVCTGMWGFREECLRRFGLGADGFDLEADLYASACEAGARVVEVPIDYRCRIGQPKLVPLRTGAVIALRLLIRRLNRTQAPVPRRSHAPERTAEGAA